MDAAEIARRIRDIATFIEDGLAGGQADRQVVDVVASSMLRDLAHDIEAEAYLSQTPDLSPAEREALVATLRVIRSVPHEEDRL